CALANATSKSAASPLRTFNIATSKIITVPLASPNSSFHSSAPRLRWRVKTIACQARSTTQGPNHGPQPGRGPDPADYCCWLLAVIFSYLAMYCSGVLAVFQQFADFMYSVRLLAILSRLF